MTPHDWLNLMNGILVLGYITLGGFSAAWVLYQVTLWLRNGRP